MLPSGPRSTYSLPSRPEPGARDLARQIVTTIRSEIRGASEVRVGAVTTGCDGCPLINPLDGTSCNGDIPETGACSLVLFNPATRTVVSQGVGRAYSGSVASCEQFIRVAPVTIVSRSSVTDCETIVAGLRARRRFVDNLGNMYGPDGAWLTGGITPAELETDYVHRYVRGQRWKYGDPPTYVPTHVLYLEKASGMERQSLSFDPTGTYSGNFNIEGFAQGLIYPSVNDIVSSGLALVYDGEYDPGGTDYTFSADSDALEVSGKYTTPETNAIWIVPTYQRDATAPGLDDMVGQYTTNPRVYTGAGTVAVYDIEMTTAATPDKYKWRKDGGSYTTNVSATTSYWTLSSGIAIKFGATTGHSVGDAWTITVRWGDASASPPRPDSMYATSLSATPVSITGAWQNVGDGMSVKFKELNGHTRYDRWNIEAAADNTVTRYGVAVRGTIDTATACVNGGFPNNNVLMTTELAALFPAFSGSPGADGSHALVVRDPDTLELRYRKALDYDTTGHGWGDPPELFSFSTNDEGLFFMHCYTTPSLASPPTPYPGHEFGAPNPRKVAVVSVNPLTFEPTIGELITLEDNGYTAGASFAVAVTVP